ncbi:hypothetical protein [Nonomuraea mesophila]|uniref:hypothetical protein n=1 Tax=Nonomuraea mesophila TaxID=2530382 RepID=UPI00140A8F95|nr:hypothetical protein [Nonomuraea mesophila]
MPKTLPRYQVVGPRSVRGVAPGGVVALDPARFNVEALVEAGHIKPVPPRVREVPE